MNNVNIIGTITKDVDLKYLPSGTAVGTFSIAVNQDYKNKEGQKVEKVSFFDIKMIGKQAETVNQFFHKGSRIAINGELEQETWTAQDGSNRNRVIIKMKEFSFIDRKSDNQGQQSSRNEQSDYRGNGYNENVQKQEHRVEYEMPEINIEEDEIPF